MSIVIQMLRASIIRSSPSQVVFSASLLRRASITFSTIYPTASEPSIMPAAFNHIVIVCSSKVIPLLLFTVNTVNSKIISELPLKSKVNGSFSVVEKALSCLYNL